jgi:signal transduction histidine kinase
MIGVDLEMNPVPIVAVEANRMHQVLGNLLSNAEDAMPDGGTLRLAIGCDDHWVWLDFADTGAGITAEHLPLVFEPFFTTKGLLAGGHAGNPGLGLSVVHGIIMEMGGEIAATSEPDQGAGFRIRFPHPGAAGE